MKHAHMDLRIVCVKTERDGVRGSNVLSLLSIIYKVETPLNICPKVSKFYNVNI